MNLAHWYLLIGAILITMVISASIVKRMPLTTAIFYLAVGISIGPMVGQHFHFNPLKQSALFEIITEIAVLISLYSAGLKLQASFENRIWRVPIRLATISVVFTVFFVTALGIHFLDLSLGAAILLGAIVAPTDPVLATDVQVSHHMDRDRLRFSLTGEAAMNDGTAFPFVMLGLGLLGYHELGASLSKWVIRDLIWATICGVGIGVLSGMLTAVIVDQLRKFRMNNEYMNDFLGLGLISTSYGLTLLAQGYGFLAVFFAAYTLRQTEYLLNARYKISKAEYLAQCNNTNNHSNGNELFISQTTLCFNEQLERLVEVVLIVLIGGMLFWDSWMFEYIAFALILFFIIRPASVYIALVGTNTATVPFILTSWFGIRGIGSLYYLMYAIQHGIPESLSVQLISVVLITVTLSIILHGMSVTPLMNWYSSRSPVWKKAEVAV